MTCGLLTVISVSEQEIFKFDIIHNFETNMVVSNKAVAFTRNLGITQNLNLLKFS